MGMVMLANTAGGLLYTGPVRFNFCTYCNSHWPFAGGYGRGLEIMRVLLLREPHRCHLHWRVRHQVPS